MSPQDHKPPLHWLSYGEAAQYLRIAVGTLRNLVSQRRIPHAKRGRIVRFRPDDLDAWLSGGTPRRGGRSGSNRAPHGGKGGGK